MFAYLNKMRFYKKELPNVDEIVMCNVEKIQEECIYVKLIEYDDIEGMVQLADASTRRKRKSVCLLKVNITQLIQKLWGYHLLFDSILLLKHYQIQSN